MTTREHDLLIEAIISYIGEMSTPLGTVYAPHKPDPKKLAQVEQEMKTRGRPTIRAVWTGDHYQALEGSHRLAAAHRLKIRPDIEEVSPDDLVHDHDLPELPNPSRAHEITSYLYDRPEASYSFTDEHQ